VNIEQYLQEEFEVYPHQFRQMAAYAPSEAVRTSLLQGGDKPTCTCAAPDVNVNHDEEGRFWVSCGNCMAKGPVQKSAGLAIWGWKGCRHQQATWETPLMKAAELTRQRQQWSGLTVQKQRQALLTWLAEIKLHQLLWSAHKRCDNAWMTVDDLALVEAIGLVNKLMRKNAVHELSLLGVCLSEEAVQLELARLETSSRKKRKGYFPHFAPKLTPAFRARAASVFGAQINS
jgi:hypothetical protein